MPGLLPPADPAIEISVATRGYSKGLAQTDEAQIVIRPEVAFGPLRVGGYVKNVDSADQDGEAGALIGLKKAFGKTELNGSATVKRIVAPRNGVDRTALELAVSATQTIGKLKPRVSLTYSPDDLAGTRRSAYWEAGATYQVLKQLGVSANVGRRERTGGPDYTSFNAGLTYTIKGPLQADLRWYDTNHSEFGENYKGRAVASLRAKF